MYFWLTRKVLNNDNERHHTWFFVWISSIIAFVTCEAESSSRKFAKYNHIGQTTRKRDGK